MSPSLVTPQRFAEGVTFGADLICTGSAENLVREAFWSYCEATRRSEPREGPEPRVAGAATSARGSPRNVGYLHPRMPDSAGRNPETITVRACPNEAWRWS